MKTKFRIVEQKEHFEIEKEINVDLKLFRFLIIGQKKEWKKEKKRDTISNFPFVKSEVLKFETKQLAIDYINDYNKYPIYHDVI